MQSTKIATDQAEHTPLLSNRFVFLLTAVVAVLALLSIGISLFGHRFGEKWALSGHSDSHRNIDISIGLDRLQLTSNTIRFEQRKNGPSERVDIYLLWPEMTGYDH